jgi:hypothetical protein
MIWPDTGLDTMKKRVITRIFPPISEKPVMKREPTMIEKTVVVLQVEAAWSLV